MDSTTTSTGTPSAATSGAVTLNKSSFSKLKVGDYLSETQYYTVKELSGNFAKLSNERGFEFRVQHNVIEEGMYTSNQYDEEKKVNRTQLVEILENSKNHIFQVNFNKKPTDATVNEKLSQVSVGTFSDKGLLKKLARELLVGEERTLIGYLASTEPKMGRSKVVDLEVEKGKHNLRLVDHRTINWIIFKNIKYIV